MTDLGAHQRADYAEGCGALQSERIAHSGDDITDTDLVGITDSNLGELAVGDLYHRHIGADIAADQLCRHEPAIREDDLDAYGVVYDVIISEDVAVGSVDDDPAAAGAGQNRPRLGDRIAVRLDFHGGFGLGGHPDGDDRGNDAGQHRRK